MRKTALVTGMHTSLAYLVAEKLIKNGNMRVIAPVRVRESDRVDALIRNYGENVIVSDFSPLDFQEAKELVAAADYILNLDFVGMPESEHFPDFAEKLNYFIRKPCRCRYRNGLGRKDYRAVDNGHIRRKNDETAVRSGRTPRNAGVLRPCERVETSRRKIPCRKRNKRFLRAPHRPRRRRNFCKTHA